MTTILIDIKKKLMVSDSRATTLSNSGAFIKYLTNTPKLFIHPSQKYCAAIAGNTTLNLRTLTKLGFTLPNSTFVTQCLSLNPIKGDNGDVLIMNRYNNQLYHVSTKQGLLSSKRVIKYYTGSTYAAMGSGNPVASKLFLATGDAERSVRLTGLIDKNTDTQLQTLKL